MIIFFVLLGIFFYLLLGFLAVVATVDLSDYAYMPQWQRWLILFAWPAVGIFLLGRYFIDVMTG